MKIFLTITIFLLTTQQSHAFIWLLASGWAGYEVSESSKENEIEYLDWTKKYKLNDNMINTDLLMPFDHHIKDYYHCISELSYKLIK